MLILQVKSLSLKVFFSGEFFEATIPSVPANTYTAGRVHVFGYCVQ